MAAAAHGLPGSRLDPPLGPLAPPRWARLVGTCRSEGLIGHLGSCVAAGELTVTPSQADELAALTASSAAAASQVEQELVALAEWLAAAGIDFRLVDGPAWAHLSFSGPRLRDVAAARLVVEPRYAPLVTEATVRRGGPVAGGVTAVEVRSTVFPTRPGRPVVDLSDAAGRSVTLTVGDHRLPALPVEEQLVCIAGDLAQESERLGLVRDVAGLSLADDLDATQVVRVAEAWGVADEVAAAVRAAWQTFDLADQTALSVWAARYQQRGRHRGSRSDGRVRRAAFRDGLGRLFFRLSPASLRLTARSEVR